MTAAVAPPTLSTSTYGRAAETEDLPSDTTGTPIRASAPGSGSAPCAETRMTPSTCPAATYCSTRSRLVAESVSMSVTCLPASSSARPADRTIVENSGSSPYAPAPGSEMISAIESVRWVTRLRAAELGT